MAVRTSYRTLEFDKRHLKGLTAGPSAAGGIVQADLTDAEVTTYARVNEWIIEITGANRGKSIIDSLDDTADLVDASIEELADLIASAYVWERWTARNFGTQPENEQPGLRPEPKHEQLQKAAVKLAMGIKRSGKTRKKDGTIRRWRYGPLEQGPAIVGPMSSGSLFDDSGIYTDKNGLQYRTPHRHPLDEAT